MTITARSDNEAIRIYIDGLLHVRLPRDKDCVVQAYRETHTRLWTIEYTSVRGTIVLEYSTEEKWSEIIKLLDEHL